MKASKLTISHSTSSRPTWPQRNVLSSLWFFLKMWRLPQSTMSGLLWCGFKGNLPTRGQFSPLKIFLRWRMTKQTWNIGSSPTMLWSLSSLKISLFLRNIFLFITENVTMCISDSFLKQCNVVKCTIVHRLKGGNWFYYPQRAQRAGGIVKDWQIFGYGSDFPTWLKVGTKSKAKVPNFGGNFEPSYLQTGKSFWQNSKA